MQQKRHSDYLKHRGIMLVLSSPSGAGKTTISRLLLEREKYLSLSISATTRPPRPGERDGIDYYFKSTEEFEQMIKNHQFLEHAHVFGHYYGTIWSTIDQALRVGKDVLFDIDWQGVQQIVQKSREDVVSIFILPPSMAALESRLHTRAQDSEEVIKMRMEKAVNEISHWAEYDYVIVNDDLEKALNDVRSILRSERLRRTRQLGLSEFIYDMVENPHVFPL